MGQLKESYLSEKSQLVEMLTAGWTSHGNLMKGYLKYPAILGSLVSMLESPKVDADNVT